MKTKLIGTSSNIQKIRERIIKIAEVEFNTIVCGETGVGKELVVRMLFEKSSRFGNSFVKVNCAALPDALLESEMFGYEQGAFTGALRKMRGKFEQAHEGMLFLDEIGDMSFPLQAKFLHALQDGEYTPLGSEHSMRSNAWVVSATNHDLKQDIENQSFRTDLYYRINESSIHIEPLRNRPEDIPDLIEYYGKKYALQFDKKWPPVLSQEVMNRLCAYTWPGNVRELQNVLRRLIIIGNSEEIMESLITSDDFKDIANPPNNGGHPPAIMQLLGLNGEEADLNSLSLKKIGKKASDIVEKQAISYVLDKTGWNRSKANKILGVSYKTLLTKIQDLNLSPPI
jgi:transcriptional regulator with PAS, ATPase and Fis domain